MKRELKSVVGSIFGGILNEPAKANSGSKRNLQGVWVAGSLGNPLEVFT